MIPIVSHGKAGDQGYTFSDFESNFLHICESHREEHRALAFALILHDLTQPQIAKALDDVDYWRALDQIAGRYLSVFSFHTRPGKPMRGVKTNRADRGIGFMVDIRHTMVGIDSHHSIQDGRSLLEKYFRLERNIQLPAILFFQVSNMEISGTRLVQLKAEKTEDAFIEIKQIIETAANALSEVKEENFDNGVELFDLIERDLASRNIHLLIRKAVKRIKAIKDLASLFSY